MNYILYLAFNNKSFINEAIFSIQTYFRLPEKREDQNTQIIVYTDKEDYFKESFPENKNILYEYLDDDKIACWLGENKFMYRLKIKVLMHFFDKYKSNVLLVDTDTIYMEDIQEYFEKLEKMNVAVMYYNENRLDQKIEYVKNFDFAFQENHAFYKHLENTKSLSNTKTTYQIPFSTQIWNSGVIGLNQNNRNLLDRVLDLSDTIFDQFKDRLSEQFAYSYVLQKNLEIIACDKAIFHYWYLKDFRYILAAYFDDYHRVEKRKTEEILKKYDISVADIAQLKYTELPAFASSVFRYQYGNYGLQRIRLDLPEKSYHDKIFFEKN
jgi:hypothetical protein